MERNDIAYEDFVKWHTDKYGQSSWTGSEVLFAKQIFEFLEDYGSFKTKMTELGNKGNVFDKIHSFCKEKYK